MRKPREKTKEMPKPSRNMPKDEATLRGVLVAVIKETIPNLSTLREKEWAMRQIESLTDNKLEGGRRLIKNSGIVRKVDDLGRIVVPMELRKTMGWSDRAEIAMSLDDSNRWIVLELHDHACHFCGSHADITSFRDKKICENCMNDLYET